MMRFDSDAQREKIRYHCFAKLKLKNKHTSPLYYSAHVQTGFSAAAFQNVCTADFLDEPLVGFINKSTMLEGIKNPLFKIRFGIGNNDAESVEGITDHHFYGTHITGPILEKNPHFLIYMAKLILGREPSTDHLTYERKGYENTLKKLSERI